MVMMLSNQKEIIELPPSCTWCSEFQYKKDADEIYRCKVQCFKSNDIFELFEDCPYLHLKYAVRESSDEDVDK